MPGMSCSVALCKNTFYKEKRSLVRPCLCPCSQTLTETPKISFFCFPKTDLLQKIWVQKCYRKDKVNVKSGRICSAHFKEDDFIDDIKARIMGTVPKLKLKPNAFPTINLKGRINQENKSEPISKRSQRASIRKHKDIIESIIKTPLWSHSPTVSTELSTLPPSVRESDETLTNREYYKLIEEENEMLKGQLEKTEKKLSDLKKILEQNERNREFIIEKEVAELILKVFSKNNDRFIIEFE